MLLAARSASSGIGNRASAIGHRQSGIGTASAGVALAMVNRREAASGGSAAPRRSMRKGIDACGGSAVQRARVSHANDVDDARRRAHRQHGREEGEARGNARARLVDAARAAAVARRGGGGAGGGGGRRGARGRTLEKS